MYATMLCCVPTQVVSNHSLSSDELQIINDPHFRKNKFFP